MNGAYLRETNPKNPLIFVFIAVFIVLLLVGVFFLVKGKSKIISPIPEKPSFEVIFYTPSPVPESPTSTPSGTIQPTKEASKPTATPIEEKASPTEEPTAEPTAEASPSATPST